MFENITKEQQETLLMNDIDANVYRQMKETAKTTQYDFCER